MGRGYIFVSVNTEGLDDYEKKKVNSILKNGFVRKKNKQGLVLTKEKSGITIKLKGCGKILGDTRLFGNKIEVTLKDNSRVCVWNLKTNKEKNRTNHRG